jgi:hypothetical protein
MLVAAAKILAVKVGISIDQAHLPFVPATIALVEVNFLISMVPPLLLNS